MRQSSLFLSAIIGLCIFVSFTSAGTQMLSSEPKIVDWHYNRDSFFLLAGWWLNMSTGVLDSLSKKKKSPSKSITGHREWPSNSSSTVVPTADGGQLKVGINQVNPFIFYQPILPTHSSVGKSWFYKMSTNRSILFIRGRFVWGKHRYPLDLTTCSQAEFHHQIDAVSVQTLYTSHLLLECQGERFKNW